MIDILYNELLFCVLQDACSYFLERMVTWSTSIKLTKVLHSGYVFHSKEKLPSEKLPTKRDVIERILNEENFLQQSAAGVVAKELINICIFCNVYPVNEKIVKQDIFALVKTFSSINRYSKKKRGKSFLQKEAKFMTDMDELFDIFCSDNQQRRQLEKQHLLRMTDKAFKFYSDQKGLRLMKRFNIVETLTTYDVKFAERALGQQKLLDSSLPSVNVGAGTSISAQTSDNSDYDASQSLSKSESMSSEELFSQEPNEQNRLEWPNLVMMSERYQLSDRASAAVANVCTERCWLNYRFGQNLCH